MLKNSCNKYAKRIVALFLMFTMLAVTSLNVVASAQFSDVTGDKWFYEAVTEISNAGYIGGYPDGTFKPENNMTRAEFAKVVASFGAHITGQGVVQRGGVAFEDVQSNQWFAPYVDWVADRGIVNGVDDTHFAPDDNITREQIASITMRLIRYSGQNAPRMNRATFSDEDRISTWARQDVEELVAYGVISGRDNGEFAPQDNATRAEVATIISRANRVFTVQKPTTAPSEAPTAAPTTTSTLAPSAEPTAIPTASQTAMPTAIPIASMTYKGSATIKAGDILLKTDVEVIDINDDVVNNADYDVQFIVDNDTKMIGNYEVLDSEVGKKVEVKIEAHGNYIGTQQKEIGTVEIDYLTFTFVSADDNDTVVPGNVGIVWDTTTLGYGNIFYTLNDVDWVEVSSGAAIDVPDGVIKFRGENRSEFNYYRADYYSYYSPFTFNDFYGVNPMIKASGNVMTLVNWKNPEQNLSENGLKSLFYGQEKLLTSPRLPATDLGKDSYYYMYYDCKNMTNAPKLPATTMAEQCYMHMFYNCTSLKTAPELPATTLAKYCYAYMFYGCTELEMAPELRGMNLAEYCYNGMFYGCISLKVAPELPATTLDKYCYANMFSSCTSLEMPLELSIMDLAEGCYSYMYQDCTGLKVAPSLPATTLAENCYSGMFSGCIGLEEAPVLNAMELANSCYSYMFYNCHFTTAPALPATTLAENCYSGMFSSCKNLKVAPTLDADIMANYCYNSMFNDCTNLEEAPALKSMQLADGCYNSMFSSCSNLKVAPELPAMTLASQCYYYMFAHCTSLENAPALPAQTMIDYGYAYMFSGCSSLVNAPALPASLANSCYMSMFENCTSLATAPELMGVSGTDTAPSSCYYRMFAGCSNLTTAPSILPATKLSNYCYYYMFNGCSKLVKAPDIMATGTTLPSQCMSYMFYNCSKLNSLKVAFAGGWGTSYTNNWLSGVSSTGTFYYKSGLSTSQTGTSYRPSGWTMTLY